MTSVNYPTTYSWNGSQLVANTGPTYTYAFDAMSRPTGLTDQSNNTAVSNVQYNPANQLLAISYFGANETRQYNNMNQMTNLAVAGQMNITYTFPAGTNNGKISSQTDSISGETVTYQYDSLNRLLSATGSTGWSETYGFDGFGNLVSKTPTGGAPTLSQAVSAATNRIVGQSYDANGNQISSSAGTLGYDAENRLQFAAGVQYAYDSRNKRIWRGTLDGNGNLTAQELYFYGVDGQKLGTYPVGLAGGSPPVLTDNSPTLAVFFGAKRVGIVANGGTSRFVQDRLGSQGKYYPYGEDKGTPLANDQVKFATYTRDSATGLDYADQRYYANNFGRFMSPDPYRATLTSRSNPEDPQSWNRYAYVLGDPVNYFDPNGLQAQTPPLHPEIQSNNGYGGGGGGGCLVYQNVPANPENDTPAGVNCLLPQFTTPPPQAPPPPKITIKEIDTCIFPNGTGITGGKWTLEVEYQVLVNGEPAFGNYTLSSAGVSQVSETLTPTSGGPFIDNGVWCLSTASCDEPGSLTPQGTFWDILAGNGTANQSFIINGQAIAVTFASGAAGLTSWQDTFNSANHSISVGNGAVTGNSKTRECGSKNGDPPWK
jgi:RHS repeat-associated protein